MNWIDLQPYLLALALGTLLGLQRESENEHVAGIRTFPLMALLGAAAAGFGIWQTAAGLLALTAVLIASAIHDERQDGPGFTTEVACLLSYLIGALLMKGDIGPSLFLTGSGMVLLQSKDKLHNITSQLDTQDLKAITRLALIGLVILPIIPDKNYGPYDAINPFHIWLMVVLIVGISMTAYFVSKFMGKSKGSLAAGLLGGLISSTATTASFARKSKHDHENSAPLTALVLMIASTIVFGRVLLEITFVAMSHFSEMAYPLIAMMAWMGVICFSIYKISGKTEHEKQEEDPPSELGAAVIFGLLYAGVLVGVAAAHDYFGDSGVYFVAFISGLTDVDAITLSSSQMVRDDVISSATGWRSILIGGMANIFFKGGMVLFLGTKALFKPIAVAFGLSIAGGLLILFFWP